MAIVEHVQGNGMEWSYDADIQTITFGDKTIDIVFFFRFPDKPWFRGKDAAAALDYADHTQAVAKSVRDVFKKPYRQLVAEFGQVQYRTVQETYHLNVGLATYLIQYQVCCIEHGLRDEIKDSSEAKQYSHHLLSLSLHIISTPHTMSSLKCMPRFLSSYLSQIILRQFGTF